MRLSLSFGSLLGALQFAATLLIYALGFHSSPEKIQGAQGGENLVAFLLMMTCLSLGLRSLRRREHAAGRGFNFLKGAKTALGIALIGALINAAGQFVYVAGIHPAFGTHLRELYLSTTQLSPEQAAEYAPQINFLVSPLFRALSMGLTTFLFGLLIGVAYSALFRDRPSAPPSTPA